MSAERSRCPICGDAAEVAGAVDSFEVKCPRCGEFRITRTAERELRGDALTGQQAANASGWIRSHHEVVIGSTDLRALKTLPTPRVPERGRFLLEFLASQHPTPGEHVVIQYSDPALQAVARCTSVESLRFIVGEYLIEATGLLRPFSEESIGRWLAIISPRGWEYLDAYGQGGEDSPFAFVAMRFGDETSALRDDGIKPAIIDAGFDTRIIDEMPHNDHIDDMILASIRRCRFLIADLTGNRQNVYYEAGFAQGLGLEVIWTIREDLLDAVDRELRPHLDVRQFSFLLWAPEALPDLRKRLTNRIVGTIGLGPRAQKE
jgi:hypothetical protein